MSYSTFLLSSSPTSPTAGSCCLGSSLLGSSKLADFGRDLLSPAAGLTYLCSPTETDQRRAPYHAHPVASWIKPATFWSRSQHGTPASKGSPAREAPPDASRMRESLHTDHAPRRCFAAAALCLRQERLQHRQCHRQGKQLTSKDLFQCLGGFMT